MLPCSGMGTSQTRHEQNSSRMSTFAPATDINLFAKKAIDALPEAFTRRMHDIVPDEQYTPVMASFAMPRATCFRVNTLKADVQSVQAELTSEGLPLNPCTWYDAAFWVEPEFRDRLLTSPAYTQQRIYVQNLSSMVPPFALSPEPGERVLDLAAAPGSKTLQIACEMDDDGEIAAVELVKSRFFKMRANLEAQGATSVRTFLKNGEHVWRNRPEYFDRVLLDAPCSTEGRFQANDPETYAYWSLAKIKEMSRKQNRLLYSAIQCLRPGGVLVYSTCSFAPEENELVLEKALSTFGDALELEPIGVTLDNARPPLESWQDKPIKADLTHARRILPTDVMEGFFVCRIRKNSSTLNGRRR